MPWQCASCDTNNEAGVPRCVVCGDPVPRARPAAPQPTPTVAARPGAPGPGRAPASGSPRPASSGRRPARPAAAAPGSTRRAGRLWWLLIPAILAAALLLVDRVGGEEQGEGGRVRPTGGAGQPTVTPRPPDTLAPVPRRVGLVAVDPAAVLPDGQVTRRVAAMFDTYFAGINSGNAARVLSVFDPAGVVDRTDPAQVRRFAAGIRTTRDSEVVLRRLRVDPARPGSVTATVSFRSTQARGYGPGDHPEETCTRWLVTYTLSRAGDAYRIVRGRGQHSSC